MSKRRLLLGGLKSLLPWRAIQRGPAAVGNARYGYAVWLRHVSALARLGFRGPFRRVAELGPGESIATGISAILSGSERYIALDVVRHLSSDAAANELEELSSLFEANAPIPGPCEFPLLRPALVDYDFPASALGVSVDADRIALRLPALARDLEAVAVGHAGGQTLQYIVPWDLYSILPNSVDMLFSQAVLQEIPHDGEHSALRTTLEATARWLSPGGVASHQIDLGLYGMEPWNVHWTWSDLTWTMVRGRRSNFVNREPLSTYLSVIEACGLSLVDVVADEVAGVSDERLSPRFRSLPEPERRTRNVYLVVRKATASFREAGA